MMTEVTDFQAEAPNPDGPATVVLRMTVRLVREADVSIVGARTFSATVQTPSTELADVVAGFDRRLFLGAARAIDEGGEPTDGDGVCHQPITPTRRAPCAARRRCRQ